MPHSIIFEHACVTGKISVIIPVKSDPDGLAVTLNSLRDTAPQHQPFEVLVANDGGDSKVSMVCAQYPFAQEAVLIPNRGPGGARNHAMTRASGEYIAFLDADVEVRPGWWEALREALSEHDYVGGRIDINPRMVKTLCHKYDEINAFNVKQYMTRHHGATANVAVRRSLLEAIGGFDARFRSGEDTEFGYRAHENGQRMLYADAMSVYHPPRDFQEQRKKIYRVVVGHAQLRKAFPNRFDQYAVRPHMVLSFLLPPRRLGKERALVTSVPMHRRIALYAMCYAARLYQLTCYVWMQAASPDQQRHDLS